MAKTDAAKPARTTTNDYARFYSISTRWSDNDMYGHVNNVAYYSFFDTAVNGILIDAGVLDPIASTIVGLVVETRCSYFASLTYPDHIEVGVAVAHLGSSSVRYSIGVFRAGENEAAAQGEFTHVYVDRATQAATPIPADVRAVLEEMRL
ncbi:MAG: acyl-CoA thioesterase [Rhizobiales bacterium]|nr:acyl-CoA thioesterase [Hyphomicrobiales bacterium]